MIRFREFIIARQADQAVGEVFGDGEGTGLATAFLAHGCGMQGDVVEDGVDVVLLEVRQEPGSGVLGIAKNVEHVGVMDATEGRVGEAQVSGSGQRLEAGGVAGVDGVALGGDFLGLFELGVEEGGDEFRGEVGGADVDPGVLVDFATEELGAVGTFLPDDFRALDETRVVDDQRATLAADEVLGLVEAVAAEVADGAEVLSVEGGVDPLRGVLDDEEVVFLGNGHDHIHLAGDPGVVDGDNDLGPGGDRRLDLGFINVQGVGADVHKTDGGAAQGEGVGGGDEGIGGHDDFVAGADPGKDRGHFESGGAGMSQQHLLRVELLFHPGIAFLGELAIPGEVSLLHGLRHVVEFLADDERAVEGNVGVHGGIHRLHRFRRFSKSSQ